MYIVICIYRNININIQVQVLTITRIKLINNLIKWINNSVEIKTPIFKIKL